MTLLDPILHVLMTWESKRINLQDVVAAAGRERRQVLRVMDKLTKEGYLEEVVDNQQPRGRRDYGPPRRNPTWSIIGDLDIRPKASPRKKTCRDKVWKLIRAKQRFTKTDLEVSSGCKASTVDAYVRQLEQNGYIRKTGKDGLLTTYMLIRVNQVKRPGGMDGGGK